MAPALLADDAHGHAAGQAEGGAGGNDHFPDPERVRIAQRDRHQLEFVGLFDLQHGQVGGRVHADDFRLEGRLVVQDDGDFLGSGHDVPAGQYVPLRIDDHSGAQAGHDLGNRVAASVEEVVGAVIVGRLRTDDHHRRHDLFDGIGDLPAELFRDPRTDGRRGSGGQQNGTGGSEQELSFHMILTVVQV